jgi:hypothetical protein
MSESELADILSQKAALSSALADEKKKESPDAEVVAELEEGLRDLEEMVTLLRGEETSAKEEEKEVAQEESVKEPEPEKEQEQEKEAFVTSLASLPVPAAPAALVPLPWPVGSTILAKYSGDGKEYEAVVLRRAPGPDSVAVRFLGYELEGEHVVRLADCSATTVSRWKAGTAPAIVVDTSALAVAPGDSDAVKDRKKRQLKELRRSARDAHEELTTAAKQSSWQAFAGRKGIGAGAKKARRLR